MNKIRGYVLNIISKWEKTLGLTQNPNPTGNQLRVYETDFRIIPLGSEKVTLFIQNFWGITFQYFWLLQATSTGSQGNMRGHQWHQIKVGSQSGVCMSLDETVKDYSPTFTPWFCTYEIRLLEEQHHMSVACSKHMEHLVSQPTKL